jgi:predicted nuclease of predicted toxin-antitoxin system
VKKVLLDENVPHKLRSHLSNHTAITVAYLGWSGLKNGEILKAAENAAFDVLVTSDQGVPHQQNLSNLKLAVVVLSAQDWNVLKHHVGKIAAAVDAAVPGSVTTVECIPSKRRRVNIGLTPE